MTTHRISPAADHIARRLAEEARLLDAAALAAIASPELAAKIGRAESIRITLDAPSAVQSGDRVAAFARLDLAVGIGRHPGAARIHLQANWNGVGPLVAILFDRVVEVPR